MTMITLNEEAQTVRSVLFDKIAIPYIDTNGINKIAWIERPNESLKEGKSKVLFVSVVVKDGQLCQA